LKTSMFTRLDGTVVFTRQISEGEARIFCRTLKENLSYGWEPGDCWLDYMSRRKIHFELHREDNKPLGIEHAILIAYSTVEPGKEPKYYYRMVYGLETLVVHDPEAPLP